MIGARPGNMRVLYLRLPACRARRASFAGAQAACAAKRARVDRSAVVAVGLAVCAAGALVLALRVRVGAACPVRRADSAQGQGSAHCALPASSTTRSKNQSARLAVPDALRLRQGLHCVASAPLSMCSLRGGSKIAYRARYALLAASASAAVVLPLAFATYARLVATHANAACLSSWAVPCPTRNGAPAVPLGSIVGPVITRQLAVSSVSMG